MSEDDGGGDKAAEKSAKEQIEVFQLSDAGGKLEMKKSGKYPLKKEMLISDDVMIINLVHKDPTSRVQC